VRYVIAVVLLIAAVATPARCLHAYRPQALGRCSGGYTARMFLLRTLLLRRLGTLGLVLTAFDFWRRVPERHRRRLLDRGRRGGRRLAVGARSAFERAAAR
jgi:hypothetical protein